jgi:hypothetical protein
MCKIPKNLGPGFGFSYWEPTDSLIEGVRLTIGRILGFHIAYTSFTGSTSPASQNIRPGNPIYPWSVLSEPTEFYTTTLVNP